MPSRTVQKHSGAAAASLAPQDISRPTQADWLSPTENRWAFRDVPSLFPTDRVSAEPGERRSRNLAVR